MKPRIDAFQGIRGYALLMVFVSHCSNLLVINDANALTYFGAAGVSLFLCLSGFLTAYHYLARETIPGALQIYKSKWRKFYKLHFLTLIFALPLSVGIFRKNVWKWAISLTFNAALVQIVPPPVSIYFSFNAVSWYLSLTLFLGLFTPSAVKIWRTAKKEDAKRLCFVLAAICAAEFLLCAVAQSASYAHWLLYVFPPVRFLDFLAGGLAYILADSFKNQWSDNRVMAALAISVSCFLLCLASSLVLPDRALSGEFFSSSVWALPSCCAIGSAYIANERNLGGVLFRNPFAMRLGEIGLEFFMLHQLAIRYFSALPQLIYGQYFIIYALSFAVTYFAAKTFHQRAMMKPLSLDSTKR